MSVHFSSDVPTWRLPDNLDVQLLRDAQSYLMCRHRHEIAAASERQAWEWFNQIYDPLLRRWVLGCHVTRDNVDDCLQEVWIDVVKKLPAFVSEGTQRGLCCWLHAIVHSKAVDLLRYQSRHATEPLRADAKAAIVSREVGPAAEYEQRARQEEVQRVLAVLRKRVSALTFDAFYQHWVVGHTMKQIAAELNETQRKVSCRIYKAKHKFRVLCAQFVQRDY